MTSQLINARNLAVGVAILSTLAFLSWKLGTAPLHAAQDAAGCRTAYQRATTQAESTTVDFLPYKDSLTSRRQRCSDTRTVSLDSL